MTSYQQRFLAIVLVAASAAAIGFKLLLVHVGAPYVTIDDNTMYEGGFLVWFGQAPPQRMYLESWLSGLISLGTYVTGLLGSGNAGQLGSNLVADAWREFHADPDRFVRSYRWFVLAVDMATAAIVYGIARITFRQLQTGRLPALLAAALYLLSFNTIWSDVVARPDTLTAFFGALGFLLYLRADRGQNSCVLFCSAAAFGLAAGMKLHAAAFTVFVAIDMWRINGWARIRLPRIIAFCFVAFVVFCIAAGSPLFDPLLYAKLRYQNAIDDASPWIAWGEQFLVILYGCGWLVVPLVMYGVVHAIRSGAWRERQQVSSVLLLALLWLLLFCGIRQLRSYWMLPALPLLYVVAVWALWAIRSAWIRSVAIVALLGIMLFQCYGQMQALRSTSYGELRTWIDQNITPDEPFYVLGYSGLGLPRSTAAIERQRQGLERKIRDTAVSGAPFTLRHAQLWEERARLRLFDMLDYRSGAGHTWYGYHDTPLGEYEGLVAWNDFRYVILQEHFAFEGDSSMQQSLVTDFLEVAVLRGPGGHSNGLEYRVYKRR